MYRPLADHWQVFDNSGADVALKRAARRARIIAAQTHTPFIIYKDGRIEKHMIEESPQESET